MANKLLLKQLGDELKPKPRPLPEPPTPHPPPPEPRNTAASPSSLDGWADDQTDDAV